LIAKLAICAAVALLGSDEQGNLKSAETKKPAVAKKSVPAAKPTDTKQSAKMKLIVIEKEIVKHTNAERAKYGLRPMDVDEQLMNTAREHARWMTRNRSMTHTWRSVAENIAMGQRTPLAVVRAWMNSTGHRANILSRGHTRIGVGFGRTEGGTPYWCQQFHRGPVKEQTSETDSTVKQAAPSQQAKTEVVSSSASYRGSRRRSGWRPFGRLRRR